jgi:RNA polymerase sigma-70 factor (sigma-E family)
MVSAEVAEGTRSASGLAELYVRHAPSARSLAFLLTGDRSAAEDMVQEAFVRLTGRYRHLRNAEAFGAYLRRTVVNLHTSGLRRRRLERAWLNRESRRSSDEATPGSVSEEVAGRQDLWRALQGLPPRQRAAVVLRYYEDLSERETAEILRCSVSAVKSLVTRAFGTLRDRIGSEER